MLLVKEIFGPTIQGEGETAGSPAIFIRFSGCNMWSGKEEDQPNSQCPFCDTDFNDGHKLTPEEVVNEVLEKAKGNTNLLIVISGGEPLLQNEGDLVILVRELHRLGYVTQVETNGTVNKKHILGLVDFVTCSPKMPVAQCKIDWDLVSALKLLHPHPNKDITPESFYTVIHADTQLFLQPIDTQSNEKNLTNVESTISKVKELGLPWRVSLQIHKIVNQL